MNDSKDASMTPQKSSFPKSPMRLTPNSHVKPTPTKIEPSPKRVPNPMALQSPARNTRNAKKAEMEIVGTSALKRSRNSEVSILRTNSEVNAFHDTTSERNSRKRQKFSYEPTDNENQSLQSPMPKKFQPVGILSSKKRIRHKADSVLSQRSVAFGSPEAALYHVGSPSGNFTPLPRSRAKELFAMPMTYTSAMSSKLNGSANETVEIETNLNILVDKITVDNMKESPALSPIANDRDASRIDQSYDLSMAESTDMTSSIANMSQKVDLPQIEDTVELEGGIEHLLANAMQSSQPALSINDSFLPVGTNGSRLSPTEESSPADSSVDMTDNQSIASINSRAERYTTELNIPPIDAQKLDFSFQTTNDTNGDTESMDIDEGNTVELEGDITTLLAAAGLQGPGKEIPTDSPENKATKSSMASTPLSQKSGTPVASIRFSLSPGKMLKPSAVDSLLKADSFDEAMSTEMEELPVDTFTTDAREVLEEPVTLTFDEFRTEVGLNSEHSLLSSEARKEDSLTSFNQSVQTTDSITFERWNQFLQAVCGEVEKQQTDLDGKASSAFDAMVQSQPDYLANLQNKLRSTESHEVQQDIRSLVEVGREKIESEWNNWLAVVLESFKNPLSAVSSGLSQEKEKMDSASGKCTQFSTKLSFMAGKRVQRARRKSLGRRKVGCGCAGLHL
jgi:hypothetical protein